MSIKADVEKVVAELRDCVASLENVAGDLQSNLARAVASVEHHVRELVHLPVEDAPEEPVAEPVAEVAPEPESEPEPTPEPATPADEPEAPAADDAE